MTDILFLTFIFLIAGVIAVPLASRFALGSVLGYLLAGIAISPLLQALQVDVESLQHIAEFGVVMMLFLVGMELDPKHLWSMRNHLLGLGGGQVVLSSLVIMCVAKLFGLSWAMSLAIGIVLSLSSTAIVLQTLSEKALMKTHGGQSSFIVLLTQDIAVIPILILLPLLASPELADVTAHAQNAANEHGHAFSLVEGLNYWQTALVTIIAISAVIFIGSHLTAPIFRFISMARLRELFTATALMFVIGTALLMSLVGLSPALGTFLAGVVLANSSYKHELESSIEPVKGLLLGLFFITVGASIDFGLLNQHFLQILGLTLLLFVAKIFVLLILAHFFKIRGSDKWLLALGLSQGSEFAFVLLSFTVANHVIAKEMAGQMMLVVALSMLLSPALFIFYEKVIVKFYAGKQEAANQASDLPDDSKIIIAGSGRVGGIADRMLRAAGYHTTVIDSNIERLKMLAKFDVVTYFGDPTQPDLLHAAGIDQAKLLIITLEDKEQISKLTQYAVQNYPHVHVIARAVDRHHVYDLYAYGCRDIIRETYDSSLRIGRSAFEALGIDFEDAEKMKDIFNDYDRAAMIAVADAYQVGVPGHENKEYLNQVLRHREMEEPKMEAQLQAIREKAEESSLKIS